jgi:iron complex outermembrane receptor protein
MQVGESGTGEAHTMFVANAPRTVRAGWVAIAIAVSILWAPAARAQSDPDASVVSGPEAPDAEPARDAQVSEETEAPEPGEEETRELEATGASAPPQGVESITVVGEVNPAMVQEVTASVVAFDEQQLQEARIADIAGLAAYTPNLEIKTGASSVSNPTIFIRGIGLLDFNANAPSSVAVLNDEVYQNSPLGQLFQFYDLEGVEVLRGPQGTLYGRNATAGAIRVIPRKPDGTYNAAVQTTAGTYDLFQVEGAVGMPIVGDLLSARFSGRYSYHDGYTRNRCGETPNEGSCLRNPAQTAPLPPPAENFGPIQDGLAERVNDEDTWAARMILGLDPSPDQNWTLNVNGGQSRGYAYQFQSRGIRTFVNSGGIGRDDQQYRDADRDAFAGDYDLVDTEDLDLFSSNLNGRVNFAPVPFLAESAIPLTFESVSGYGSTKLTTGRNFDASPNQIAHVYPDNKVWQATQQLRLIANESADLEFELGGFFLYEWLDTENLLLEGLVVTSQEQNYQQKTLTWAPYLRGSYLLTPWLRLDAGIRYNWERKNFDITVIELPSQRQPNVVPRPTLSEMQDETWAEPTGEIVLNWLPTDFVTVYGRYTRGFKGGHFNAGAFFSSQITSAVEPESVNAFEVGIRSQLLDDRLTLNMAAWYYDYENYQVFALENTQAALPLPQLLNARRVESRGIELDLVARPIDPLMLNVNFAILDAEFTEFTVQRTFVPQSCPPALPPCPPVPEILDFTGNPLVASPPLSMNVIASYDIELGRYGTLTPRADAIYRGKTYFTPGDQSALNRGANEGTSQDPYWLLNFRLGYRLEPFELAFWVRNVTDEVYLVNSLDASDSLGKYLDIYGAPRTYGGSLALRW